LYEDIIPRMDIAVHFIGSLNRQIESLRWKVECMTAVLSRYQAFFLSLPRCCCDAFYFDIQWWWRCPWVIPAISGTVSHAYYPLHAMSSSSPDGIKSVDELTSMWSQGFACILLVTQDFCFLQEKKTRCSNLFVLASFSLIKWWQSREAKAKRLLYCHLVGRLFWQSVSDSIQERNSSSYIDIPIFYFTAKNSWQDPHFLAQNS
jgi:hypothetical protein